MAQENFKSSGRYRSHHEHHQKEDPKITLEDSWSGSNEDDHEEANKACLIAVRNNNALDDMSSQQITPLDKNKLFNYHSKPIVPQTNYDNSCGLKILILKVVNTVRDVEANQLRVIRCYNCKGKGHIAKQCTANKRVKDSEWFKDKMLLAQAQEAGVALNEEDQEFLAGRLEENDDSDDLQLYTTTNIKTDHVDAYDPNFATTYDSNTLSELPHYDTYLDDDMPNFVVQETGYNEHFVSPDGSYTKLTSNNNVISYAKYMVTIEDEAAQKVRSLMQNDDKMLTAFEQIKYKVEQCHMVTQDTKSLNESLTRELEKYKAKVKTLESGYYSKQAKPPTKNDWDLLFQPMFDEYFKPLSVVSTSIFAATLPLPNTIRASSSTSLDQDTYSPSTLPNHESTSPLINSTNVEEPNNEDESEFDSDTFTNPFALAKPSHHQGFISNGREDCFLNGILKEEVFVTQLEGFVDQEHPTHVFRLKKALYGLKLAARAWLKLDEDPNGTPVDPTRYRDMVGSLMYLTASCPDLVFVVYISVRYQAKPSEKHLTVVKQVVKTQGKVHRVVHNFLVKSYKIPLYCDSQSAIALSYNSMQHSRMKHIAFRYQFIKQQIENEIVELYYVKTAYQLENIFTKALTRVRIKFLIKRLGMQSLTPEELKELIELVIKKNNQRVASDLDITNTMLRFMVRILRHHMLYKPMPQPDSNKSYTKPPTENQILRFIKTLGYDEDPKAKMTYVLTFVATRLRQPWRTIMSVLNRSLTGKDTSWDTARLPIL
uniref:Retrotransposon protein, putative, unclassified n=1 Tax=Tanacetum cinerariifolium TaxID=118510 RepID=A0A6L2JTL0_TANCI|nr:retrotransposon protein, putative, unclassified [Tanacetum cinerariifolium]